MNAARRGESVIGWALLALLLLYATAIHYGVGPAPLSGATRWFHPHGFLFDWELLNPLFANPVAAIAALGGVALVLAAAVSVIGASSVATALAATCAVAVALFTYYGVEADSVWRFFHWRSSAVILLTSGCIGSLDGSRRRESERRIPGNTGTSASMSRCPGQAPGASWPSGTDP